MPRFKIRLKCPNCLEIGKVVVECDTEKAPNGMFVECDYCGWFYVKGMKKVIGQGELIPISEG